MPRHGTGLGTGNFPAANKLLMQYDNDRAYQLHKQKINNVKHRLDVKEPKRHNHLILRLKQIQKEEERQAEIDHENKLLLNKMTHVLKYGGNIDNWNNYESRSLNYPFRERQNMEIARENLGIARRLETVKPKLPITNWERDFHQHQYLKRLWGESVKDFDSPRRFRSRMSRTRSLETSLDNTYDEDYHSEDASEERKLPKLKQQRGRATRSETRGPVSNKREEPRVAGGKPTKLPKITPNRAEDGVAGQGKDNQDDKSDVAQLFKIAKQLGRPDDVVIKTLIKKTHKQRMVTKSKFRQKYDLDLVSELKQGLGQQWEYLINALLQEKALADSYAVFDALSTADMSDVVELLASRDNASIAELKESYRKEFSISLEEDITDRTKPPTQTLLLTLQKGLRDESTKIDEDKVKKDAQDLFEYGDGRWDSENGLFIKLLNERSNNHLQAVFLEYKNVSQGVDILQAMKKECHKDYYKTISVLVQSVASPHSYYADTLHKHKLPSDPVLVGTLVSRSEIDMPEVKKTYKKVYGTDIVDDIKAKPHPTQRCLIELANKIPPGSKKKPEVKKTYTKDGAPNQQNQPQPAQSKKNPAPPLKKTDSRGKGQVGSESGNNESNSKTAKTSEPSQQQSKQKPNQEPVEDTKKAPSSKTGQVASKENQGGSKGGQTGGKDGSSAPKETNTRGTVKPAPHFKPDDDCVKLNGAMTGERADESVVVSIIPKRSNQQRQTLKSTYEQKYKKNLTIDLTSEMTGDWEEIVLALMMTPTEYDCHIVREAVEGLGTSEPTLISVICTRSAKEIKAIKDTYSKGGGGDFDKDITRDCGADLKTLLLELTKGLRQDGTTVNMQQAQKDAQDIQKGGIGSEAFVTLLSKQNHFQVKATLEQYKKLAGEDIYTSIVNASLGDDEDVYISIVRAIEDPVEYYCEKVQGCFTSMGTNDNLLIRMIVPRSEIDLEDIKLRYLELNKQSLYEAVNSKCRGDYKAMLLAVINNDESDAKGEGDKKNVTKGQGQGKKENNKSTNQNETKGGTVKPIKPFNPIDDSERLNEAMSGFGTDESIVIDILPYRTNDQRQEIKAKYQDKYQKNLQDQLETELRGDFEEIVLALMMKPLDYICHCLHESVAGLGTREAMLVGILGTKTAKELATIKTRYKETYGKDLETDISQDVSRGFEDMLMAILKCDRDQSETPNISEAKEDARLLYKEGQISIDPTDDVYMSVIAKKSRVQVRATFQEYKKLTGNDIYYGIEKALLGDDEDGYISLAKAVEDPVLFYTEAVHKCFDGMGTNDTRLIRIIVARSEIDLADIKTKYKSLYNKTISERIQDECNGDYKKMLLAILRD
ncbi:Annexin A11 [Mactra antiquata]